MKLVLINQYFPPDEAPTGLMLESVAEVLAQQGHSVTVLCSAGGYAMTKGGAEDAVEEAGGNSRLRVIRIGASRFGRGSFVGKLLDYASFYLGVSWQLLRLQAAPDRVVALTTPPFLSLLARFGSWLRGGDHAHWVMDLYPDVMVSHGMLKANGGGHRCLAFLSRLGFGGSRNAMVLTLGPDMQERVADHLSAKTPSEWVPLWATEAPEEFSDDQAGRQLRRERGWSDDEMIVMYSGNMGLGHRFGEFLDLLKNAERWKPLEGKCRFVFYGRGKRRTEIEAFIKENPKAPVELHDYVARSQLGAHLRSADVHLASLEPSWDGTMVPSKLQGIFAIGRPVIFVGSGESSIGRWVEESRGGWRVTPGDAAALDSALLQASDATQRRERGDAALRFAERHFQRGENARRVAELFGGSRSAE
ncbi:glycosyltransferase family 4 protein [Haloferula chungangensis]|uniref:Glycosyltransferase family 4 protein n=1 Tax=Haloferula chungangensis TaxID=1048331 RepID=A0ABW2L9L4_9BACT